MTCCFSISEVENIIFVFHIKLFHALPSLHYVYVVANMYDAKKKILKSNSFDVMQTLFFAFTCKLSLVL